MFRSFEDFLLEKVTTSQSSLGKIYGLSKPRVGPAPKTAGIAFVKAVKPAKPVFDGLHFANIFKVSRKPSGVIG